MLSTSGRVVENCEITAENYKFLQQHVYKSSGIVLEENKEYLLETRLAPIVRRENLKSINDLCRLVKFGGAAHVSVEVVDAITTNETLFFRDALPFKAMKQTLLPPLIEARNAGSRKLRFWSAACSSGQEAYSLAMMCCDLGLSDWEIEILGTDINRKMVNRARAGSYVQLEMNRGLPASHLVKYFDRDHLEWRVTDELSRMVRFEQFDLRNSLNTFGLFDFVLCRNVLIYFDLKTKREIFRQLETAMPRGSYLLLGAAETTTNLTNAFERVSIEGATFFRRL